MSSASFITHLNYVKRMSVLLSTTRLSVSNIKISTSESKNMKRFFRLYKVTQKSIVTDISLSGQISEFAIISTPWLPVKCYYALYYLESILVYLISGDNCGFKPGGHTNVREKIYSLVKSSEMVLSNNDLNNVYPLSVIKTTPRIPVGSNTRNNYWNDPRCTKSITVKLMDYKLFDAKQKKKWNLHTKKGKKEKQDFISNKSLMLIDFFYWYRVKANYRDLDYIDFESGLSESEVIEYMKQYFSSFNSYRKMLVAEIHKFNTRHHFLT